MEFKEFQSSGFQFPPPGSEGLPVNDPGTDRSQPLGSNRSPTHVGERSKFEASGCIMTKSATVYYGPSLKPCPALTSKFTPLCKIAATLAGTGEHQRPEQGTRPGSRGRRDSSRRSSSQPRRVCSLGSKAGTPWGENSSPTCTSHKRQKPGRGSASSDFTPASVKRANKCLSTVPDDSPRSPEPGVPPRLAFPPPPPRCSPAPRCSPGRPSERSEGRWSGARGLGARSEPWRPPPATRREEGGRRAGPGSRERWSRPVPESS